MKVTRRSIVLALSGLVATGVVTGLGMTTHQVSAQDASEAPGLAEVFAPSNVRLTSAALDFVRRTTGKLYVTFSDGYWQWGTATVVNSESKDMLLTSGSVLTDEREGRNERPVQVRFAPAARRVQNGVDPRRIIEPYGSWTARTWAILPNYDRNSPRSSQNNVAVVLLNTLNDDHIQNAVGGGRGICFDCPRDTIGRVHIYSYQQDILNGESLDTTCQVIPDFRNPTQPFGTCIEGRPTLGKGSSGAAVITDLDPKTGHGKIVAINTWTGSHRDGTISNGGAYLSSMALALYEGYRRQ